MILIIAEKPKAAKKIAGALGQVRTVKGGQSYYYEVGDIVVAPAVGHLYGLVQKQEGWGYPVFDIGWKPSYTNKGFEFSKSYVRNLEKLGKQADEIIIATDYDIEGAVIGANIVTFAAKKKDLSKIKRMKFSALTENELRTSFDNAHLHNQFEIGMAKAGILRHNLDWYWGINLSRALSHAYRRGGQFKVLSTGRVQGPALKLLTDREREIKKFTSNYFYVLHASIKDFMAESHDMDDLKKAYKAFESLKSPARVVDVSRNKTRIPQPPPFNLTDLQTEASRVLKYTPKKALEIAQKLYEDGFISYPRTSSQQLPKELKTDPILKNLSQVYPFATKFVGRKYNPGKKTDPAHPAIYPTGEIPRGREQPEMKLYDLIARRFMASFSEPAVRESTKILLDVSGIDFMIEGIKTLAKGFTEFYPAGLEERDTPKFRKGDVINVDFFELVRKQKKPPKRYTAAGLLKLMDRLGIGTKATRAGIIQTLYDRGYIEGKSIEVTELGERVIGTLESAAPDVVSVELTERFEKKMQEVHEGQRDMEEVLEEARANLTRILEGFKTFEKKISTGIVTSTDKSPTKSTPRLKPQGKPIGECGCGGLVHSLVSQRGKKYARCSKCDKSWGLPQRGTLTITNELCKKCKLKLIYIKRKDAQFKLCIEHGFS